MITSKTKTSMRKRHNDRNERKVNVWAEKKPRGGGWIIYAGSKGSDTKTVAGAAASIDTLEDNLRRARARFSGSL